MLSHVTDSDRIAIFRKLTPVSFSRIFRTCKWANNFIEDNKMKFKIRTDQSVHSDYRLEGEDPPLSEADFRYYLVIESTSGDFRLRYEPSELEKLCSEVVFQCFVFEAVRLHNFVDFYEQLRFTMVDSIPARKLQICGPFETISRLAYNYDSIEISRIETHMIDPIFDVAEGHRHVSLSFNSPSLYKINPTQLDILIKKSCNLMQKMLECKAVTKQMTIVLFQGIRCPNALLKFLEKKKSEIIVLAAKVQFHIIPVSQESFLTVEWNYYGHSLRPAFVFQLMEDRETFLKLCWNVYRCFKKHKDIKLSSDELGCLPVVQGVCERFFST